MQTQILGLVTPLMALLFAVMFAVFWRAGRMKRHVLGFAIGYVLFACGFLVTHFMPADAFYLFHTTQAFYSAGMIIYLFSVCERAGKRIHLGSLISVYLVSAGVLALAVNMTTDVGPRLIIVNTGYGTMCAIGLTTLLASGRRAAFDIAIIAVVAIQVVDFLVRPNLTLMFEKTIPAEAYRESVYYSLIGLVLGVKSVIGAVVLIGATIVEWTEALRANASRDPLTGLQNRAAFEQSIRSLLPRAQSEECPLSLIVVDIDHFKQVNDVWGHQAGDQVLSNFGELASQMVRDCDVIGRIGGEEFCIAVWNCDNEPAERLAQRIKQGLAQLEHSALNSDIRLTASFGLATAREGESYERLFARADEALYRAKDNGRDRVENAEGQFPDDKAASVAPDQSGFGREAAFG